MAPLTWRTLFTAWDLPVPALVLLVAVTVWYLVAAARTPGRPVRYTVAFLAGVVIAAFALGGAVDRYSGVLFSVHMAQHLLLIMVVPVLLLAGRPFDLVRGRVRRLLRPLAPLTHPLLGFGAYAVVVVGTHLTPFLQVALTVPAVHGVEELLYLAAGLGLLIPLVGVRPGRPPMPHLLRLVLLLAAMVVDAVVGVALLMTPYELFPAYAAIARSWGPGLVEDLHWGGAAMWVGGDALMAAVAILVISRWLSTSERGDDLGAWLESARRSALSLEDAAAVDDDEEALSAYNAMLARLAEGRGQR